MNNENERALVQLRMICLVSLWVIAFVIGYILGVDTGDDQYQLGRKMGRMEYAAEIKAEKPDFNFASADCYLTKKRYPGEPIAGAGDQGYRKVVTK